MKLIELRIGNWYSWFSEGKTYYYQIEAKDFQSENYKNFEGITLTDEWLINLGAFEFDNQFIFDRFRIKYRPDYKFYYVLCRETNAYITKVEFVHEWQNVVFALNNQELILKNK